MEVSDTLEAKPECTLYKTQWRAFYKTGLGSPAIVYGESIDDAMKNALALFRKNNGILENWPVDHIVDHVDFIGQP